MQDDGCSGLVCCGLFLILLSLVPGEGVRN